MKVCCTCKDKKSLDLFGNNKTEKDGKQRRCRECTAKFDRAHFEKYYDKHLETRRRISRRYSDFFDDLKKGQSCQKCGEDRWYTLDYHHKDPKDKRDTISTLQRRGKVKTLAEIEKCVLLCSNCHREFHFLERESSINLMQYLEE